MNRRHRPQAQKKINRHDSAIGDKRRARTGAVQSAPRYDRADYRNQSMRGEW